MSDRKIMGRPLLFETPEDLKKAINKYFEETEEKEITVTGLALALGTSRESLNNYSKKEGYQDIVNQARLIVQNSYEKDLRRQGRSGDIFALKNFGWKDKQEVVSDNTHTIKELGFVD